MMRSILLARGPTLMSIFSLFDSDRFDKPVNSTIEPLVGDELGWDRVKKIFRLNEEGMFTKELQSIINTTLAGGIIGTVLGGMSVTKHTVNNFIANNEATKFPNQFDAKRQLQQDITVNFIKKGGRLGAKVALFCFLFNTITTCTTAYRGKLTTANYILGGAATGFLFKMNLGLRAALVGTGLGGILGGLCGSTTIAILWLADVNMNEVLEVQQNWIKSRDESLMNTIRTQMNETEELLGVKQLYEINQETQLKERNKSAEDHKT